MKRTRAERIALLTQPGVIAVVRAPHPDLVGPLTDALIAGGVLAIEITMTTPNAIAAIAQTVPRVGDRGIVGVGTVLDAATARQAVEAGAEFVVSPILRPEIVRAARGSHSPVMLGAYTPTEAQLAHEAGADFVKLFPADTLGPAYIRALRAPLPHLRLVPTGGVDVHNVADFLHAGCAAVGAGSSLVPKELLSREDWPALTRLAKAFVDAARSAGR